MIYISMFSIRISVFGFVQLIAAVKFVPLQPCGHKYFLTKKTQTHSFAQPLTTIWIQLQTLNPIHGPL